MAETKDPVAALGAKEIPLRAAGARDLALAGLPEHIDRLIAVAIGDKSPGVRLAAAGAAADILSRHRLPPRRDRVSAESRAAWLRAATSADPAVNPGLFGICGCLGTEAAFKRVLLGLRDPRQDIRAGACVGLWRTIVSAGASLLENVEALVVATVSDTRIRVESRVEIAKICADVGYLSALAGARELPAQCTRNTRELAEAIVLRLEALPNPAGLWVRSGLDAGAIDPKCTGNDVLLVLGIGDAVWATGRDVRSAPLEPGWRVLSIRETAREQPGAALQIGLDTWWPADGDDLCRFGDRLLAQGRADLLARCDEALGTTSAALRVRGAALLASGRSAEALLVLEAAVAGKKVPADAYWFLAQALRGTGRTSEATAHLEKFVAKAAKKAPWLEEAKRQLAGEPA